MEKEENTSPGNGDPYDLNRFLTAQEGNYDRARAELQAGEKRSHWMWYIFPQIEGLGHSATARYYSIKSLEEARRYLHHPVLGARLKECSETVLAIRRGSASDIFGYPDDMKLQSSMTLFALITGPHSVFERVLGKYFQGKKDSGTLRILGNHS